MAPPVACTGPISYGSQPCRLSHQHTKNACELNVFQSVTHFLRARRGSSFDRGKKNAMKHRSASILLHHGQRGCRIRRTFGRFLQTFLCQTLLTRSTTVTLLCVRLPTRSPPWRIPFWNCFGIYSGIFFFFSAQIWMHLTPRIQKKNPQIIRLTST